MDEILKHFNELYSGKQFYYVSKYGRTKGIVKEISVQYSFILDDESNKKFESLINKDHTKQKEKSEVYRYIALQPNFFIKSTNNVVYELEMCYFCK